ncbi:MAG: alpha/beta fold hydrolase [Pseudomonadota bacterium]
MRRGESDDAKAAAALGAALSRHPWRLAVAAAALALILLSLSMLNGTARGLERRDLILADGSPVTIHRLAAQSAPRPVIVIAHGFAGSRQLMAPFALSLARSGFIALSFDFLGHGRHRAPMTGDITKETGATAALVAQLRSVAAFARTLPGADGRIAFLGHSMASDIIIRAAIEENDVAARSVEATLAVSMFSSAVTAEQPRNLLIIVGGLERFLTEQALIAAALKPEVDEAAEGVTYGAFEAGSARRAAVSRGVDHVGVLYSRDSLAEAVAWARAAFEPGVDHAAALPAARGAPLAVQGPWIIGLLAGLIALAWPLAALLPRAPAPATAPPLGRGARLGLILAPALATPLLLRPVPIDFLPVLVADYLAVHFALYGALSLAVLAWLGRARFRLPSAPALIVATLAITLYGIGALGAAVDGFVTSYWPHPGRLSLIAALALGAGLYAVVEAWASFDAPLWARIGHKLAFLGSLALATALNLEDLFFLIIIFPVLPLFFLVFGLFARWAERATGHPGPSGLANGLVFAWALGCVFPIVAG